MFVRVWPTDEFIRLLTRDRDDEKVLVCLSRCDGNTSSGPAQLASENAGWRCVPQTSGGIGSPDTVSNTPERSPSRECRLHQAILAAVEADDRRHAARLRMCGITRKELLRFGVRDSRGYEVPGTPA